MAAIVIKSATTDNPKYGATELKTYGWTQSESNTESGTWAQVADNNGQVVARILFDSMKSNQVTIVVKDTATLPALGSIIDLNGVKYIVEQVAVNAVNNDATRATLTVSKYQGIDPVKTP